MRDYSRKPYRKNSPYPELLRGVTSKAVWNSILEVYPTLSEFSRIKSSFDRSVEQFIRQSERKKPYAGKSFEDMEDEFEGYVPGIIEYPGYTPKIDLPTDTPNLYPDLPGLSEGSATSFSINAFPCYCVGAVSTITVVGTHPLLSVSFDPGTIIAIIILSPEIWNVIIDVSADTVGLIQVEGIMRSVTTGQVGNAWDSIIGCGDWQCCLDAAPVEWDYDSSAGTIGDGGTAALFVTPGKGPYFWSITSGGAGFTLDESVTTGPTNILRNEGECGTCTITVEDACESVTTGDVLSTLGSSWQQVGGKPTCGLSGTPDVVLPLIGSSAITQTKTSGGQRQTEKITPAAGGSVTCPGTCSTGGCDCNNPSYTANGGGCVPCLTMPAGAVNSSFVCRGYLPPSWPLFSGTTYCLEVDKNCITNSCGQVDVGAFVKCYASYDQYYEEWLCNP